MRIKTLSLFHTAVPLRKTIKHASHERGTSENLVVRVTLADGSVGYGEGVPRSYVTGESVETTFQSLSEHDWARVVGDSSSYGDLVSRLSAWEMPENAADLRGRAGNAARCAVELAILDAYGHHFGESIGRAVELAPVEGLSRSQTPQRVRYSSAITAESFRKECISAIKTRLNRFQQVKVKVGVPGQDDPKRLSTIRKIVGRRMDIRIDANESWTASELIERVEPLKRYRPSALEQPVAHAEVEQLAELRPRLGIPVMLDESLCGYPDALAAIEHQTADILNVRLSKCGGIFNSLRIMGLAFRSGLGVQLGCHPGETAILSAAGRHVASRIQGIRYVEGSYDRYVLGRNVTSQDLTFGFGGWAPPLEGTGLGIQVDPEALQAMTKTSREISYA